MKWPQLRVFKAGPIMLRDCQLYLKTGSKCGMMHMTRLSRLELLLIGLLSRNRTNIILKYEKEGWQTKKLQEASKNSGKIWRSVKYFLGWTNGGPPTQLSLNGNLIRKPVEIAQEMNTYFANKISNIVKNLPH